MKLCISILACAAAMGAQTFPVQGDVIDSMTGQPIAGAQVAIRALLGSRTTASTVCSTDTAGHFQVTLPMPVASVIVSVGRTGFAGKVIAIWKQSQQPLRISIAPQGVLSGKVEDEDGFPAEGTRIEAVHYVLIKGQRKLMGGNSAVVDDLGEYRMALKPGSYYVCAVPSGKLLQWDSRYAVQYYGGGWEPQAENRVTIAAGQELHGIDLQLNRREGVSISGRVAMPEASGGRSMLAVRLESLDDRLNPGRNAVPDWHDGSFFLRHVPPGKWLLRAPNGYTPLKAGDLVAEKLLQVGDTDIRDIVLSPHPIEPRDLSGTLVFQGDLQPHTVTIGLRRDSGASLMSSARTNDDGSFTLKGVLPGHYRVELQATVSDSLAGVSLGYPVSVRIGDREVLHQEFDFDEATAGPLRIALSDARGTLEGKLVDKTGQPVVGAHLMLYSDWCQFPTTTDETGSFHYSKLFPGEYYVVPTESPNSDDAQDADLPPVHVVEGSSPPVVLTLK